MKTHWRASTVFLALGLGAAGALAQTNPSNQPPGDKGQPQGVPAPKAAPMHPAAQAAPTPGFQAGPAQATPTHPEKQVGAPSGAGPMHAGPPTGHASTNSGLMRPHGGMSRQADDATVHQQPGFGRPSMHRDRTVSRVEHRWNGAPGYARPYGMRSQRFERYGETPTTWSPRDRGTFGHALGYGYAPRARSYEPRYREYASRPAYYRYRPRVRYAYAETPYAYDLPRDTYATGIFATTSAVGLHAYDYAYTTRVRPIAAYGGATGSYAGGYGIIYNRPLAPAYPSCACD